MEKQNYISVFVVLWVLWPFKIILVIFSQANLVGLNTGVSGVNHQTSLKLKFLACPTCGSGTAPTHGGEGSRDYKSAIFITQP